MKESTLRTEKYTQQRRTKRTELNATNVNGELNLINDGRAIPFYIIDISEDGFGLWVPQEIAKDSTVVLTFNKLQFWDTIVENNTSNLSFNEGKNLRKHGLDTVGKVVWLRKNTDDFGYRIGVEISGMTRKTAAYRLIVDALGSKD